jgi:HK97 family phage major capsid protein
MSELNEMKIYQGGAIKQLEGGKIGGYLVTFSDETAPDLEGDFFTQDTDFGSAKSTPIWFNHRLPLPTKNGKFVEIKTKIGEGEIKADDRGVLIEAVLYNREQYEEMLDSLGWSSGTAGHLIDAEPAGRAYHITHWPLGLDASLTPTPAEPRNKAVPLKSLIPGEIATPQGAGDAPANDKPEKIKSQPEIKGDIPMSEEKIEINEPVVKTVEVDYDKIGEQLKGFVSDEFAKLAAEPPKQEAVKAVNVIVKDGNDMDPFKKFLMPKHTNAVRASKALEAGTDSEGGYVVPEEWRSEIVKPLTDNSYLRAAGARVISIAGGMGDTVYFPILTNSTAAVLTAEEAGYDEVDASFGQLSFTPYKYTRVTKVTEELANRNNVNLWGEVLAPDIANAFVLAENGAFTTGTGSSQPAGVVTGAGTGKTTASATAITGDEIIDLYHSLDYKYRQNAVFMMNDAVLAVVRKLKDGNSQYLWQPGLSAGQPDTILGRPVLTNNSMASAVTTGQKTILFGDMSYYWIVEWENMTMDVNPYLYMANGYIGYFARKAFDAKVALADAFKLMVQA